MPDPKKQLSIALTEPVVFLRSSDPSGRNSSDPNDPPALVRGVLTLNVTKPIAISTVDVELSGMLVLNHPEPIGSRLVDLPETRRIFSTTVTIFRADEASRARHSVSVGPGLSTMDSNEGRHRAVTPHRAPSLPRGRSERQNTPSVLEFGPTPPYTEMEPPIQLTPGTQALQALRLDPTDVSTEEHDHGDHSMPSSSRSHFSSFAPSVLSDPSISTSDSYHRASDNLGHELAHVSSPLPISDVMLQASAEQSPRGSSPNPPFRAHSPESAHASGTRSRSRGNGHDPMTASNHHFRLSLTSVFGAVKEITSRTPSKSRLEEKERGRSRARNTPEAQSRTTTLEVGEGVASLAQNDHMGPHPSHGHSEHREHFFCRFLGLDCENEKDEGTNQKPREHGESWREFKPGTYNFPISFLLPPHVPPTFSVPNGSLNYTIKAVAHRPGTFTSKLSCHVPLLIVTAPAIGAGDPGPLYVEQQWRGKLAYSLALSSRLFLLGSKRRLDAVADQSVRINTESPEVVYGAATLDLTFLPIEKIKIWKLKIFMDQRVTYYSEPGRSLRPEDRKELELMELHDMCTVEEISQTDEEQGRKNKHKQEQDHIQIPLLPTPISPHRSPLLQYLSPSSDSSMLAGPGPYSLSVNIGLPGCNDSSSDDGGGLHFTVKQKSSNVMVRHSLRLLMRVEHVGDNGSNEEAEKKKLCDISVQTPVTILSCRCVPEYLPRYSQSEDGMEDFPMCACENAAVGPPAREHGHEVSSHLGHGMTPSSTSSCDGETVDERCGAQRSSFPSHPWRSTHANPPTPLRHSHPPSPANWAGDVGGTRSPSHVHTTHSHDQGHHHRHVHPHSQSITVSVPHVHDGSQTSSPHHSRPPSPLTRYERLVSGLESEAGEAPPSYESVTSEPDTN